MTRRDWIDPAISEARARRCDAITRVVAYAALAGVALFIVWPAVRAWLL